MVFTRVRASIQKPRKFPHRRTACGALKAGCKMGDEVLEGYAAHLQIVFDHYASNEVLDEQGFHAFLRDSHVSPDPLPDKAVARIFNSGARGKGELGFEEFCECLERVSVKAFQVMGPCCPALAPRTPPISLYMYIYYI